MLIIAHFLAILAHCFDFMAPNLLFGFIVIPLTHIYQFGKQLFSVEKPFIMHCKLSAPQAAEANS